MLMAQSLGQARRNSVTSFQNYSIVIIIILILIVLTIILTRPYAALRAGGGPRFDRQASLQFGVTEPSYFI